MKRLKILIAGLFVGLLQFSLLTPFSAKAETVAGNYTINVNTPGTFAQVLLQTVDNWSDVVELTISGHLNASDMAYFSRLQKLRKLDLSQTDIKSIGGCSDLSLLKEVDLPKSVTKIEENAFYGCSALVTIDLNNIEEIGKLAFGRCGFKGSIFGPKVKFIGVQAFGGCNYIESISFPVAEEIQHDGFSYMSRLTTVDIPNVKTLGYEVFEYCKSLSNVKLSDDLEDIPDRCFQSTALKSIVLPSNLKTIGDRAFFCSNISSIELPEGLKDIKSGAFERCLIETIILPSTLESIGSAAFSSDGGALTGPAELKDVYCKCVVPLLTTTFRKDWVKDATLHVPACSLLSYKLHENWNQFNKIVALTEDVNNITVNNDFSFIDHSGIAENANLTLASSKNQNTAGHLTIESETPLNLNSYTQYQNFVDYRSNMYYDEESDSYINKITYPYCTTLIGKSPVSANEIKLILSVRANEWNYISFPFDVDISDIKMPAETKTWELKKYSGENRASLNGETWLNVEPGSILNAYEGYILYCSTNNESAYQATIEMEVKALNNKNNIFIFDDITINLKDYPSKYKQESSWNLISNPYPAYFNIQDLDSEAPLTLWNGKGFTAYSPLDDSYYLQPNESFFVQRSSAYPVLRFNKEGREHKSDETEDQMELNAISDRSLYNFYLAGDKYTDKTRLVVNPSASADYEPERDACKFLSTNSNLPQLYFYNDGIRYSINETSANSEGYTIGIYAGEAAEYTLHLETLSDNIVWLVDTEAGIETNISQNSYTFIAKEGFSDSRFRIKVTNEQSGLQENSSIRTYAPGSIYNIQGQEVGKDTKGILIINGKKVLK